MERVTTAAFTLLVLICCSAADYTFELELDNYYNPSGKCRCVLDPQAADPSSCYELVCCDNYNRENCTTDLGFPDVYFIICLREFDEALTNATLDETQSACTSYRKSSGGDGGWLNVGERVTTHHAVGTTSDISFDCGYSALLGAPNPLSWVGRGAIPNEGLELVIEVWDHDDPDWPGFDDLVDRFILRVANHSATLYDTFTGQYDIITAYARLQTVCASNSYGSDCGILCVGRDDDQGHYTCDSEGNKVCRDCYQNPETNCTAFVCSSTLHYEVSTSRWQPTASTAQDIPVPFTPSSPTPSSSLTSSGSGMDVPIINREHTLNWMRQVLPALIVLVVLFVVVLLAAIVVPQILVKSRLKRKNKSMNSSAAACYEPVKYNVCAETVFFQAPAAKVQHNGPEHGPLTDASSADTCKNKVLRFAVNPVFIEERSCSPTHLWQECEDDIDEPVDFLQ